MHTVLYPGLPAMPKHQTAFATYSVKPQLRFAASEDKLVQQGVKRKIILKKFASSASEDELVQQALIKGRVQGSGCMLFAVLLAIVAGKIASPSPSYDLFVASQAIKECNRQPEEVTNDCMALLQKVWDTHNISAIMEVSEKLKNRSLGKEFLMRTSPLFYIKQNQSK